MDNLNKELDQVGDEDAEWFRHRINQLNELQSMLSKLLEIVPAIDEAGELDKWYKRNPLYIPFDVRWRMYSSWKLRVHQMLEKESEDLKSAYQQSVSRLDQVRTLESSEICSQADVVGITTTGAAKQRALIELVKPKIGI